MYTLRKTVSASTYDIDVQTILEWSAKLILDRFIVTSKEYSILTFINLGLVCVHFCLWLSCMDAYVRERDTAMLR